MAFWKRRSRQFEPVSPLTRYTVTYLGHEKMTGKVGLDNTMKPVDNMYRRFKKVKAPCRMQIEIVNNGIRVEPLDADVKTLFVDSPFFVAEGPFGNVFFPINKLSFGAADPLHSKVFCFVSKNENPSQESNWDCHAVVCESSAMAKNLTLYLVKAFQRIADSKSDPVSAAQRTKKTTVVHIMRERGTMEHQLSSKKKGKRPPVSTLKVTLNMEGNSSYDQSGNDQCENNRKVADILARHRSMDFSNFEYKMVVDSVDESKDNGNIDTSGNIGTSSSDKENEAVDDIAEDMDDNGSGTREVVVTMAVNPSLSSPPESPRKSPLPGGATSSGEEEDDDGQTSPQEMITTMSPPDTPGYLSKDTKPLSPTLPVNPSKAATPKLVDTTNKPPSPSSPKIPCTPKEKVTIPQSSSSKTKSSPNTKSPQSDKVTSDDDLRRKDPTPASSTKSNTVGDSSKKEDVTSTVPKNESSPPSPTSSPTSTSPVPDPSTESAKSAVKKVKRATRKSVRFAVDDELID